MAAAPITSTFPASSPSISTPAARRHRQPATHALSAAQEPPRAVSAAGAEERARRGKRTEEEDEEAERRRKEEGNRKIASRKALSVILRREATKAVLDTRKPGKGTRRLLPRTVLEALHERIAALRWDSALKVLHLLPFP
jgi:ribosomal protein L12E/L44/L45/RPP1/RPP2